jgi:hypothetical protein
MGSRTHIKRNNGQNAPLAAAGPAVKSFVSDVAIIADVPTNDLMASIGGTIKSSEFVPEPYLKFEPE